MSSTAGAGADQKYETVVHLKTAMALGLTAPPRLLVAAERLRCTALVAEAPRRRQSASAVATSHGHETALFGPWPDYAACVAFLKSHAFQSALM
jgi:hypothetical protein